MTTMTIPKSIFQNDDLVIMPRRHYDLIMANMVPTYYLKGKAARRLDRRVAQAMKEYRTGKLRPIASLREII